jgi:hypothetical protein
MQAPPQCGPLRASAGAPCCSRDAPGPTPPGGSADTVLLAPRRSDLRLERSLGVSHYSAVHKTQAASVLIHPGRYRLKTGLAGSPRICGFVQRSADHQLCTAEGLGVRGPALHPPQPRQAQEYFVVPPVPALLGRKALVQ